MSDIDRNHLRKCLAGSHHPSDWDIYDLVNDTMPALLDELDEKDAEIARLRGVVAEQVMFALPTLKQPMPVDFGPSALLDEKDAEIARLRKALQLATMPDYLYIAERLRQWWRGRRP